MIQIQITEISNGFVVGLPPSELEQKIALKQGQQPMSKAVYCVDYKAVCAALKEAWPVSVVG